MPGEREEVKVVVDASLPIAFKAPTPAVVDAVVKATEPAPSSLTTEERAKRKAFFVTALDRGVIHDRLKVDLPPHLYGEWVRRDKFGIDELKGLGFWLDSEYSESRSLHSDGTKVGQVADVVFMVTTRENKELIDEVKHERFLATHAKRGANTAKEEKDFATAVQEGTDGEIKTLIESKTRPASADDVAAAIGAMSAQTTPKVRT